ncbi:MAG: SLOG family protein [Pseudonocardiaceae bacterium]
MNTGTDLDLFGDPVPGPCRTPAPEWITGDLDDIQAVLRLAITEGYVLVGSSQMVYRHLGGRRIEGASRHETNIVFQLLDTGWANLGAPRTYQDPVGELTGRPVLIPTDARRTLRRWEALRPQRGVPAPEREGQDTVGARRVLVTGSRDWADAATIRDALREQWGDGQAILVSGACPSGADRIAETLWTRWGGRVERHPANWVTHGRSAGFRRNTAMVSAGATVCLAFIQDNSPGASHTADLAEHTGIPTDRYIHPAQQEGGRR